MSRLFMLVPLLLLLVCLLLLCHLVVVMANELRRWAPLLGALPRGARAFAAVAGVRWHAEGTWQAY